MTNNDVAEQPLHSSLLVFHNHGPKMPNNFFSFFIIIHRLKTIKIIEINILKQSYISCKSDLCTFSTCEQKISLP